MTPKKKLKNLLLIPSNMYTIWLKKAYCRAVVFERGTSHPRCIFEPLSDNQNVLAAVTTNYAGALENWEEALVYGEINLLFQKWSTFGKVSKWTNFEALLNHFK